jgi:hypothetical protein
MFSLVFAPECTSFAVALAIMLLIALAEGASLLIGHGLSHWVDGLLPDSLGAGIADGLGDAADGLHPELGPLSALANWFYIGRVPVLILLVGFLTVYGFAGLFLQASVNAMAGRLVPEFLAAPAALAAALPCTRAFARVFARYIPKETSSAVSAESFVGLVATVNLSGGTRGNPTRASLHDAHGQRHYLLVEPDEEGISFSEGDKVLIVSRHGVLFRAIPAPATTLS